MLAPTPTPSPAIQPQPPAPPPAASANTVNTAVAEINRRVDGTGWLGAQTQGDDKAIVDTLRNLSPADAAAAIAELDNAGRLDDVARAATSSSVFTSTLSATDRQQFFADMAGKVDGNTMAALTRAFSGVGQGDGTPGGRPDDTQGRTYAQEIGRAVAAHAPSQAKVDYVTAMAPATVSAGHDTQFSNGLFSNTMSVGTPGAIAVGEVLGSLRGSFAQSAFAALSADQQKSVFQSAIGENLTTGMGSPQGISGYDTRLFDQVAIAAASMPGAHDKAQVFAAGAEVLRGERIDNQLGAQLLGVDTGTPNAACAAMATSLSKIIDADPSGVVNDLALFRAAPAGSGDRATASGDALGAYAKQMLVSGDASRAKLGQQLSLVAVGSDGQPNAQAAFNHATGGQYRTATGLGYFIGATSAAAKSIEHDAAKQNELISNVLKSGLTILDKTKVSVYLASAAKDWASTAANSLGSSGGRDPTTALTDAAVPHDARGYDSSNSDARSAFLSTLTFIADHAVP